MLNEDIVKRALAAGEFSQEMIERILKIVNFYNSFPDSDTFAAMPEDVITAARVLIFLSFTAAQQATNGDKDALDCAQSLIPASEVLVNACHELQKVTSRGAGHA